MNQVCCKSVVSLVLLSALSVSCSDPSPYHEQFRLDDAKSQKEFIKRLENSDLDFRVGKDGYIHYRSRDREAIHDLAFKAGERSFPVPENAKSWKISQEAAKNIVLGQYPNILKGTHMFGPVTAKIQTQIEGFAKANEEVWHVRIHCNKGGANALFFVHSDSGQLFVIRAPNEEGSSKCD